MKRAIKVVAVLVLVLGLLAAGSWYLFFERPDISTGLLLNQAESMVDDERYDRAIMYYRWAWSLEPQRHDIPIQLAETYIASGNYTKAEYTLVKAISAHPQMTELYAALCRTYVAQDKLLDAVQMLDRTTDSNVKAELDAMRPAAPTVLPESGYYNDYIEVTVEADTSIVYATSNGEYPSSDADFYQAPIRLSGGETTVLAVAVDENGLVSPLTKNGYTVGGVVEAITLQDPAVDQTVREQLNLDSDDELMSDVLWSITHLVLPETVRDLSDLPAFTGLQSLTIQNISGMDFSILSQLPALQELDLSGCTISSNALESIGSLTELTKLTLNGCALTDITAFSQLTKLKELHLANNTLTDIGVLSLFLELETLDISNNPLTSIAGLSTCSKLAYLNVSDCAISTLGSLTGKTELTTLLANRNEIRSIDELADCKSLHTIEINNNLVKSIAVLTELPMLTRFEADQNEISYIPDFDETTCVLVYFGVDYNMVEDLSGLTGITSLNYVNVDYSMVTDLTPLAENRNLVLVNAWDCGLTQSSIDLLTESSIIVNYNPNFVVDDEEEEEDEDADGEEDEEETTEA